MSIHDSRGVGGGRGVLILYHPHLKKSLTYILAPSKKNFGPKMEKFGQKMSFFDQPLRFSQMCCKIS
jgi:hypothetical protein